MIVVTGGAGFIGSAIIKKLNEMGIYDIAIVDKIYNEKQWKNLLSFRFYSYWDMDEFYNNLSSYKIDCVVHMGACSSTTEKDFNKLIAYNYTRSVQLYTHCKKHNIRFIAASSAATYGKGDYGFDDKISLDKLTPLSPYAFSKHMFDCFVSKTNLLEGEPIYNNTVILKYFNVFGPNEYHKGNMASVIYKWFCDILLETPYIKLFKSYNPKYENGKQARDFIYIKDVVDITYFFIEHPEINGIYNVGTGKTTTFLDIILCIFKSLNMPGKIKFVDLDTNLNDQYQYYTCANIDKLREVGCDHQFYSIEDAIKDYISVLISHFYS